LLLPLLSVFALWWIFFTMASNRNAKKGFTNATLLELLYIPALISLGLIAACFSSLFEADHSLHSAAKCFWLCHDDLFYQYRPVDGLAGKLLIRSA
jgi:hypothetical protein